MVPPRPVAWFGPLGVPKRSSFFGCVCLKYRVKCRVDGLYRLQREHRTGRLKRSAADIVYLVLPSLAFCVCFIGVVLEVCCAFFGFCFTLGVGGVRCKTSAVFCPCDFAWACAKLSRGGKYRYRLSWLLDSEVFGSGAATI